MNKFAIIAAAALTASTFGMAAIAQDTTAGDFDKADGNQDGLISWEEAHGVYPTLTEELFKQADENGDGNLDEGEYTALQGLTAGLDDSTSEASSATSVQQ
jgi:hypothetical protein